jgi:hypothetical protein
MSASMLTAAADALAGATGGDTSALADAAKGAGMGLSFGPVGAALGGAAGLIAHYAPSLFSSLFGMDSTKVAAVSGTALSVLQAVTGSSDPATQAQHLAANPDAALQVQVQLAQISADLEKAKLADAEQQRETFKEQLTAELVDTQSARTRDAAFIAAGKTNTRANVMVIGAAIGLFACLVAGIILALFGKMDTQIGGLIIGLVVTVAGVFGSALSSAYNFEFGSSRGSGEKQDQMSAMMTQFMSGMQQANLKTVPVSALKQLQGPQDPQ